MSPRLYRASDLPGEMTNLGELLDHIGSQTEAHDAFSIREV